LTINGSNFASDSSVTWNGTASTTTFVTPNQVTIAVPAAAITDAGTATVVVMNPAVSGGIYGGGTLSENSNSMTFTIN
jgi:Na+/H+ antiporter NhaC